MKSEPVEVYIIGGSVTFGSELKDTASQRWSTKFKKNLNNGWINSSINIHNIAVPACRVESWLHKVNEVRHADLVIVDLSVNDQGLKLKELPHLYRAFIQLITDLPNHPAIYFHQAYRTSNFDRSNLMKYCPNENEQAECCDGYLWCKRWWLMQDSVAKALKSFQIPFASYRDLVWPAYASPPKALPQFWNGLSHPDYKAHNLIAKLMTFAFMMQFREAQANYHNHNHSESESKFETMRINCYPSYDVNNGVDVDVEEAYLYNFTGFSFSEREREREIDHTNKVGAASTLTKKIRPVCRNHTHLTSMIANDQADSKNNFALASPITNWKFYDDSKSKFGYIIQAKLTDITNLCNKKASKSSLAGEEEFNHMSGKYINMGGKYNHIGEWCNEATNFTQISFPVEFGNDNPILQIAYLKSYNAKMGSAIVWVDDLTSINVTLESHWDLPYSVTHFTTISQKNITNPKLFAMPLYCHLYRLVNM